MQFRVLTNVFMKDAIQVRQCIGSEFASSVNACCCLCDAHDTETCKVTSVLCGRPRRVKLESEFCPVVGHQMTQDRATKAIASLGLSVLGMPHPLDVA